MPDTQVIQSRQSHSGFAEAALRLLEEARQLETHCRVDAAEAVFRAAVTCDSSIATRLALVEFYDRTENFEAARTGYHQLWRDAVLQGDPRLLAVVLHNLATIERRLGNWSSARSHQLSSISASLKTGHSETGAADLTNRALDAMATQEYELAESLLLRSLVIEHNSGSLAGQAADYGNLGVLAGLRGDLNVALRFLARAYSLHRELGDMTGAGSDLLNLSEIFVSMGRFSLGAKCLVRAVEDFRRSNSKRSLKTAKARLAEVRRVIGVMQHDPSLN